MHRSRPVAAGRSTIAVIVVASGFCAGARLPAQGVDYVKAHYTKYEYRIPMRDGVQLFTSVYVPKDTNERYPIMLDRTPYSVQPYGVDAYKSDLGPVAALRHRRLHRGLPGRPRTVDVGGRVRQHAAAPDHRRRARATSTRAPTRSTRSTG